ncbi:MAG: histidine kinase [Desulfuromonas sp.]|nr:MAG: histidine kinase [Desulfuromonas sp.]
MLKTDSIPTFFAKAERAEPETLQRQVDHFSESSFTKRVMDAIPSLLMILNEQRQIVYANQSLLDLMTGEEEQRIYGMRPGEILSCINSSKSPAGCGTSEECSTCGAVLAILAGLKGEKAIKECRVTRSREGKYESLDLQVWSTPLTHNDENFTVFAVNDISHEKRRKVLEKVFFHDILNLVGSIKGFTELLRTYDPADKERIFELVQSAAEQTIDEIEAQRTLLAVESGELQVREEIISVGDFLPQVVGIYQQHEVAEDRSLELDPHLPGLAIISDRTLLNRVLGNMIKNALEASRAGEVVTVSCQRKGDRVEFSVHNPGVMDREAQLQIFQRSFSTKGNGRGLGTYSMRLLSEALQGDISFTSSEENGTTFVASYPLQLA